MSVVASRFGGRVKSTACTAGGSGGESESSSGPSGDATPATDDKVSTPSSQPTPDQQDISLSEADSADDFEDALSDEWSDEQVDDLQQIYEQAGGNTENKHLESAAGDAVKGAITGAVSGGAAGTVAGPVGTVVGAGVGAVSGAVGGAAKGLAGSGAASFTRKLRETGSLGEAGRATVDSFTSEMREEWYDLDFSLGESGGADTRDGTMDDSEFKQRNDD
ncbi:hypothetical protein I7X12_05665 [Halosimplex litoreum]|uniref:Glycine zipper domain-containing protein n=1 Tax=Halosimplex litoreum TaxID=1198301 RepID=A0A7T3G0N5_9EURY|nr:hypothetical protein [Halosimplex litoreum]QPV64112.1 hypothetical protein I7X12_05665 [Halosimplex litoreum]